MELHGAGRQHSTRVYGESSTCILVCVKTDLVYFLCLLAPSVAAVWYLFVTSSSGRAPTISTAISQGRGQDISLGQGRRPRVGAVVGKGQQAPPHQLGPGRAT